MYARMTLLLCITAALLLSAYCDSEDVFRYEGIHDKATEDGAKILAAANADAEMTLDDGAEVSVEADAGMRDRIAAESADGKKPTEAEYRKAAIELMNENDAADAADLTAAEATDLMDLTKINQEMDEAKVPHFTHGEGEADEIAYFGEPAIERQNEDENEGDDYADVDPNEFPTDIQSDELELDGEQIAGLHGKIDANNDGKVSLDEIISFSQWMRARAAKSDMPGLLEQMDLDNNSKVSSDEFMDYQFGKEQSDPLSSEELESELTNSHMQNSGFSGGAADHAADVYEQESRDFELAKFKMADKNGDGVLDVAELPAATFPETDPGATAFTAARSLKQRDKDGNGELSPPEMWQLDPKQKSTKAQREDFASLDKDKSGGLNLNEIEEWESGTHQVKHAMKGLLKVADKDNDQHISLKELKESQPAIKGSDASSQFSEWAKSHEL